MVRVCAIVTGRQVSRSFTLKKNSAPLPGNRANETTTRALGDSVTFLFNLYQVKVYNANNRSMKFLSCVEVFFGGI
jgi:hypothetical protein